MEATYQPLENDLASALPNVNTGLNTLPFGIFIGSRLSLIPKRNVGTSHIRISLMQYGFHNHSFHLRLYILVVTPSKEFLPKLGTILPYLIKIRLRLSSLAVTINHTLHL